MKFAIISLVALLTIAASFFASRALTLKALTDETSIFDTFEKVDETWLYSDKIGAAAASDVERARVAIGGPLGLSSQEAVYFVATRDNQGDPLQSDCSYRVAGRPIDTRWWSLTLYDSVTQHYVPNIENRSSWNSISIPRSEDGAWTLDVGQVPQKGAWLPTQEAPGKAFELMLRVYNPSHATRAILPNLELPDVERVSC
ncbi:MAG: DUF1214 domain-containing protein [Pseudomonadota bacterium]